jgi:GT2 family glycosyltransferase
MLLLRLVFLPFLLVQVWQAVVSTYLALVAAASFLYRKPHHPASSTELDRGRRFLTLIPAHNEEALLGRLLTSLAEADYPRDRYDVAVVADNCTDATAEVARRAGVTAFERFDTAEKGKGHALRWLMQQVALDEYDAVFIVDADSVVSANVFEAANAAFERGARLVQVYDGVYNRDESPAAGLRALAFDLHNRVRPMGQSVLGVSVGLMGNGMFIATDLLRGEAWDSFGLAEDMEAHAKLVALDERVRYVDGAFALAEMPASLRDSEGQNERWEAGRIEVARRHAPKLALQAIREASWPKAATAIDLSVPPQSAQLLLACAGLALAKLIGPPVSFRLAVWTVVAQGAYLALGLTRLGRGGARLRDLQHAPGYVLWKAMLYLRVLGGRGPAVWTRGHREPAAPTLHGSRQRSEDLQQLCSLSGSRRSRLFLVSCLLRHTLARWRRPTVGS